MEYFTTKRHFFRFYILLVLVLLLMGGVGIYFIQDFYGKWGTPDFEVGDYLLLFLGGFMVMFAVFFLIMYFKNAPIIRLHQDRIAFGKESYDLKEVAALEMTGKFPFGWGISLPEEGACLSFKDGTKKYIFDMMYANGPELKVLLERKIHNTSAPKAAGIRDFNTLRSEGKKLFKGNPFFNFRASVLWLIIGTFLWHLLIDPPNHNDVFIFLALVGIVWFLILAFGTHYFGLTNEYFFVHYHYLFWKKHVYALSGIEEVVFESPGKGPYRLRLITRDYQTKIYAASTLKTRTWLKLKKALEQMEVQVRNEAFPEG
ncbi:hypothetical protein [Cyclobacterium sp.]|uniref:hypothetical protein n=1 Tax=Cyclobacterium sp. TaxID=1966343 RepID=UPI0019C3543E|nr:hypothetical protein [Cyclobacterium sp.]MBD3628448.1 hypothetical protein [Cyclobacterium sp.]